MSASNGDLSETESTYSGAQTTGTVGHMGTEYSHTHAQAITWASPVPCLVLVGTQQNYSDSSGKGVTCFFHTGWTV